MNSSAFCLRLLGVSLLRACGSRSSSFFGLSEAGEADAVWWGEVEREVLLLLLMLLLLLLLLFGFWVLLFSGAINQ